MQPENSLKTPGLLLKGDKHMKDSNHAIKSTPPEYNPNLPLPRPPTGKKNEAIAFDPRYVAMEVIDVLAKYHVPIFFTSAVYEAVDGILNHQTIMPYKKMEPINQDLRGNDDKQLPAKLRHEKGQSGLDNKA